MLLSYALGYHSQRSVLFTTWLLWAVCPPWMDLLTHLEDRRNSILWKARFKIKRKPKWILGIKASLNLDILIMNQMMSTTPKESLSIQGSGFASLTGCKTLCSFQITCCHLSLLLTNSIWPHASLQGIWMNQPVKRNITYGFLFPLLFLCFLKVTKSGLAHPS